MITLDEVIKNFEEEIRCFEGFKKINAVTHEDYDYIEKTRQLAEWLRELKAYKNKYHKYYKPRRASDEIKRN